MEYLYPINLINRQGDVVLAYTADEVLDFVEANGWFQKYWVTQSYFWDVQGWYWDRHPSTQPHLRRGESYTNEWIARDDRGRRVDPKDFTPRHGPWWSAKHAARTERRDKELRAAIENGSPIPGVRRCRGHRSYVRKSNGGRGVRARNASLKEYDEQLISTGDLS